MTSHGIHTIDTGFVRPRFDAAYLVADGTNRLVNCPGTSPRPNPPPLAPG